MSNILITGTTSYIGKYLTIEFLKQNKVYGISRSNPNIRNRNFNWLKFNILYRKKKINIKRIDYIIHVAGSSINKKLTDNDYIKNNLILTYNFSNIISNLNPKLIFYISSREIYGDIQEKILTTKTPILKPTIYGSTKLLSEKILNNSFNTISLRCPAILGVGTHGWISKIFDLLIKNKNIYFDNNKFNNCIHVSDLFKIITDIINSKKNYTDCYNVCCSNIITSKKVIEIMKKRLNSKSKLIYSSKIKNNYIISNKKILNISKTLTVEKALNKFLREKL
jgi:nucleoside-diphosphate-sugar epimerase